MSRKPTPRAMRRVLDELEVPEGIIAEPKVDGRGGKTIYSEEMVEAILTRLRAGDTFDKIVADPEMPSKASIFSWKKKYPDFARRVDAVLGPGAVPFDQKVADEVLDRIEAGERMREIFADEHIPGHSILARWRRDNPAFAEGWVKARENSAEPLEHEALHEAYQAHDKDSVAVGNLRVSTLMRIAAIRNPKTHGAKVEQNIQINIGLADRLSAAIARAQAMTIEGEISTPVALLSSDEPT